MSSARSPWGPAVCCFSHTKHQGVLALAEAGKPDKLSSWHSLYWSGMFSSPVNPELQRLPAAEVTVLMMSHPVQHRSSGLCTRTTHAMRDKLRTVPGSFAFPVKKARFPRAAFPVSMCLKSPKQWKGTNWLKLWSWTISAAPAPKPGPEAAAQACTAPATRWSSGIYRNSSNTNSSQFYPWIPAALPALKPHFLNPTSFRWVNVQPCQASQTTACTLLPQMCSSRGVLVWLEWTTGRKGAAQFIQT